MKRGLRIPFVLGMVLLLATAAAGETHVGDWDVTGEITGSGNFHTFGDSSYVTPFSGWSGSSRMVAVRQPTSVSSGVSAGFMFSNNQTGNSHNIAQLMFLNEAIGAAEKRVAQILVQTGGTTNSGKMFFRVYDSGVGTNALTINRLADITMAKDVTITDGDLTLGTAGKSIYFGDGTSQSTAYPGSAATGSNATIGGGTGNTATGISGMYVESPNTTVTLPFRIVGLVSSPPGANGTYIAAAYNQIIVAFNNASTRTNGAGPTGIA